MTAKKYFSSKFLGPILKPKHEPEVGNPPMKKQDAVIKALIAALWSEDDTFEGQADEFELFLQESGYVVVPVEPTEAMCDAVRSTNVNVGTIDAPEIYKAMLAASQQGEE